MTVGKIVKDITKLVRDERRMTPRAPHVANENSTFRPSIFDSFGTNQDSKTS